LPAVFLAGQKEYRMSPLFPTFLSTVGVVDSPYHFLFSPG
jgi:hypothetical protein